MIYTTPDGQKALAITGLPERIEWFSERWYYTGNACFFTDEQATALINDHVERWLVEWAKNHEWITAHYCPWVIVISTRSDGVCVSIERSSDRAAIHIVSAPTKAEALIAAVLAASNA